MFPSVRCRPGLGILPLSRPSASFLSLPFSTSFTLSSSTAPEGQYPGRVVSEQGNKTSTDMVDCLPTLSLDSSTRNEALPTPEHNNVSI